MMQIIIYSKTAGTPLPYQVMEWDTAHLSDHFNESFRKGTVLVARKSDFSLLAKEIAPGRVLNCGIKQPKVELFRALKLHQQQNQDLPRRIIAGYSDLGAFRRSFNRFFKRRYQATSPACLLFITDDRVDEICGQYLKMATSAVSRDPLYLLMSGITLDHKLMEAMSGVYIGDSMIAKLTRVMIYKAAKSALPVLIMGETGTGKELIARLVFEHSDTFRRRFFAVNCSAIPDTLLESELFGHKKGSFTGALDDKTGIFEAADKGTLFLDEIGDLTLQNQAKLLRAIEEQEIRPVGSNEFRKISVRIITATNRNLAAMVRQKTFREDLFHRLNSIPILAFPLRKHPEDIPVIASAIWSKRNKSGKLSGPFLDYLKGYAWPGNVRELKALLHTISDLFPGVTPGPEHIEAIREYRNRTLIESGPGSGDDLHQLLKAQSHNRIIEAQNILREIKVALRTVIHDEYARMSPRNKKTVKDEVGRGLQKLESLCREPIYLRNRILFDHIKRFRYLLDKSLLYLPDAPQKLMNTWLTELQPLHATINDEIYNLMWDRMDL